jgi:hypothetical protein
VRQKLQGVFPPMFVLDRARLKPYTDDAKQFDNRYTARVPSMTQLSKLGITNVLYVTPSDTELDTDDLNDDFVYTVQHGGIVRILSMSSFTAGTMAMGDAGAVDSVYFYGNDATTHEWFWKDYPWSKPYVAKGAPPPREPSFPRPGKDYVPVARPSPFSSGAFTGSLTPTRPATFGLVPVVVAATTGIIMGARMSRSGSWTRSSSWGGG